MKTKGLIILLCIFAMAFPALGATVAIGNYNVASDGSVVAQMIAKNVTNLGSVTVKLTFDPAVVHVASVVPGSGNALTLGFIQNIDNSIGFAIVTTGALNGLSGNVIIADFTLNAVGSGGASSPLNITINSFADAPGGYSIPATPVNGIFSITSTGTQGGTQGNSGTSGGGGGGGGGGGSGEDFLNIILKEKYDKSIFKDKATSYAFTDRSNPIQYVNITGNINAGEINTAVEVLKTNSSLVKNIAPGIVYKNVNIWLGTTGFAVPRNIKESTILFRVENSWLGSNSLVGSDIRLLRWDGSQWTQLETAQKTKDDTYTYFEAKTEHFSSFAISGLKGVIVPTPTPEVTETQARPTGTPSPSPTKKASGFELVFVASALFLVHLFSRKRR